jgi:hypothetical protein
MENMFSGLNIYVTDKNGNDIREGNVVKVNWTAELGITELECEAIGIVRYVRELSSFWVIFDTPYTRQVSSEGEYEATGIDIIQADEDMLISFEVL